MGIAEQSLVSTAAGMAWCGLRPFAASPASFLSTRSMEQVKVDVAYSHTNVKLIGISGGISYGALGMTHHSAQDIAALASIPGLRVYLPSDRFLTQALLEVLVEDNDPAYIRVGRNAVEDVYNSVPENFQMDKALTVREGTDVTLIACGELVRPAWTRPFCWRKRASPPGSSTCTASNPWTKRWCSRLPGRPRPSSPPRSTACTAAWAAWSARWWGRATPSR